MRTNKFIMSDLHEKKKNWFINRPHIIKILATSPARLPYGVKSSIRCS